MVIMIRFNIISSYFERQNFKMKNNNKTYLRKNKLRKIIYAQHINESYKTYQSLAK